MQKSFTNGLCQEASFIYFLNRLLKLLDNVPTPYSLLYSLLIDIKLSKYALKDLIQFQTFSSQSKIRIRALILMLNFNINEMHIRFCSIQMEITKSQFRTNCAQLWLVCISARHVFHVFASLPYNAPVRV